MIRRSTLHLRLRTSLPWTADEDEKVRYIARTGVIADAWPAILPGRVFGEIVDRRLELGLKTAPPL